MAKGITRRDSLKLAAAAAALTVPGVSRAQEATPDASPAPVAPPQAALPKDWGEVAGQYAEVNGIRLYYEIYGEGDPLVLIHGGLGNGTYWAYQIPVLAEHYQVIVTDSRGHGRSTFNDTPIGYAVMASDILALLDQLQIPAAHILGWSDGGIITLEIAINHPDRLLRSIPFAANSDPTGVRLDVGTNAKFNAYIAQAYEDYLALSPEPDRWDAFLANIGNMWATEPNYTWDQLRSIPTELLILDGLDEEAIDLNQTKMISLLIPDAPLYLIEGTGHFAFIEKHAEFTQLVLDFLAHGTVTGAIE